MTITKFDVWTGRQRRRNRPFYRVLIFPNLPAMRAFVKTFKRGYDQKTPLRKPHATTFMWGRGMRMRDDRNQIGVIAFAATQLGHGIVNHEMAHAALAALSRGGVYPQIRSAVQEERFCVTLQILTMQFWRAYWRIKDGEAKNERAFNK